MRGWSDQANTSASCSMGAASRREQMVRTKGHARVIENRAKRVVLVRDLRQSRVSLLLYKLPYSERLLAGRSYASLLRTYLGMLQENHGVFAVVNDSSTA